MCTNSPSRFFLLVLVVKHTLFSDVTGCVDGGALYYAECTLNGIDVSREMTDISWILIINIFAVLYLVVLYGTVYIIDRGLSALFAKFRETGI